MLKLQMTLINHCLFIRSLSCLTQAQIESLLSLLYEKVFRPWMRPAESLYAEETLYPVKSTFTSLWKPENYLFLQYIAEGLSAMQLLRPLLALIVTSLVQLVENRISFFKSPFIPSLRWLDTLPREINLARKHLCPFSKVTNSNDRGICVPSIKIVLTFWKGVYSKRKEFAPRRSKFFPFRVDPFSEGAWCAGKQTGSNKSNLPFKNGWKRY